MLHPVKTPIDVFRTVTRVSYGAARHPLRTAGGVATQGRGLVAAFVSGHRAEHTAPSAAGPVGEPVAEPAGDSPKPHGDPVTEAAEAATSRVTPAAEPQDQVVTEPSTVTGPGDEEEIPSSAVEFDDEDIEVTTPVGTTGAGLAFNPDTTETDLQQPGTEPLMDPSTTKRIKAESDTLRKASDPKKG
jgi:hypothetical protein